jgi:hypothetical protein
MGWRGSSVFRVSMIAIVGALCFGPSAKAQQQGYLCGHMGDNVPNKCTYTVNGGQKTGYSTCSIDPTDPTVGYYTDCAGGASQRVQIIGGLYACCAVDASCAGKRKPAYVAACSQPSSKGVKATPASPGLVSPDIPLGIGFGIGGFGHHKSTRDDK